MVIIHGTHLIITTIGVITIGDITGLFGAHLIMVDTIIAGLTIILIDMVMAIIATMDIITETMDTMVPITAIEVIITTEVLPIAQVEEEVAIQEDV